MLKKFLTKLKLKENESKKKMLILAVAFVSAFTLACAALLYSVFGLLGRS